MAVGRGGDATCEVATPTLMQMEWTIPKIPLTVSVSAVEGMDDVIADPPKPTQALTG